MNMRQRKRYKRSYRHIETDVRTWWRWSDRWSGKTTRHGITIEKHDNFTVITEEISPILPREQTVTIRGKQCVIRTPHRTKSIYDDLKNKPHIHYFVNNFFLKEQS